jgi:DNA-binding MarR family transcriptional regulator
MAGSVDSARVMARIEAATTESSGGGVPVNDLLDALAGDRGRLDRTLAELDERGLIRVLGGPHTHDARVFLRSR